MNEETKSLFFRIALATAFTCIAVKWMVDQLVRNILLVPAKFSFAGKEYFLCIYHCFNSFRNLQLIIGPYKRQKKQSKKTSESSYDQVEN